MSLMIQLRDHYPSFLLAYVSRSHKSKNALSITICSNTLLGVNEGNGASMNLGFAEKEKERSKEEMFMSSSGCLHLLASPAIVINPLAVSLSSKPEIEVQMCLTDMCFIVIIFS